MDPGRSDSDPAAGGRRRRTATLAGLAADVDTASRLCEDPDPSVRSAALGALARLGALTESRLVEAFGDSDSSVRLKAAKLAGRQAQSTAAPLSPTSLLAGLTVLLSDSEPLVAESAAWALGEWGQAADGPAVETLGRMATGHADFRCRESAVAALGAIGAPRSLAAILDALDDKPAVRRRAVIALSAFDDPRAESALRKCLEDRDWQVRQAAEDLVEDTSHCDPDG